MVAQRVEQPPRKEQVTGANPVRGTTIPAVAQLAEQLTCNQKTSVQIGTGEPFNKAAYQREYMRRYRAKKRGGK